MRVVLVGATGTIGKPIATLLRGAGHELVPGTRHSKPSLNMDDPASIDSFYQAVGEVDAVICVAGSGAFAPLADLSDDQLHLGINSKLLGQVNLVRKGLSNVRPGGVFVLTGGMLAYDPWPTSSPVALVNAALEGFVRAASLDLDKRRILVVHPPWVRETLVQMGMDGAAWPPAAEVASLYLEALKGDGTGRALFLKGYEPSRAAEESHVVTG